MRIIQILDHADQKFSVVLDGQRVSLRLRYNPSTDRWTFDLSRDGHAIIHGRKIIGGVDLLAPFNLGIGAIFCYSEKDEVPNRRSLPDGIVKLYHASQEEVDGAVAA